MLLKFGPYVDKVSCTGVEEITTPQESLLSGCRDYEELLNGSHVFFSQDTH